MMADHFIDDETQELLGEIGIEIGVPRQLPQPLDLSLFAPGDQREAGWSSPYIHPLPA
jgi:hypothetical protein